MSIYDSTKAFAFGFEVKKLKYLALVVILTAVIALLAMFISTAFNQAIEASFFDNPINLQEKAYTLLEVKVTNVTGSDASNVEVTVSAKDKSAIFVGPWHEERKIIPTIERNQYRKRHFLIVPRRGISEGSYIISVKVTMNSHVFEKELALVVKPR
ncbi:MAG: hypothetical protein J7L44_00825 [Candidatus Diapherotrites archaeon]|nr:hypothetical protein [Candidatus Diapherotrites archaeon]